jgi:uncharacterized spore protein YtfJ
MQVKEGCRMSGDQTGLLEHVGRFEEALTVRRVFGEPYEKDGVTVIPAARVHGAAGGGGGEAPGGEGGTGTGFALSSKPFGVFVMKEGNVSWRPAIDVNRVILGAQLVAITALLVIRSAVKARRKDEALRRLAGSKGCGG